MQSLLQTFGAASGNITGCKASPAACWLPCISHLQRRISNIKITAGAVSHLSICCMELSGAVFAIKFIVWLV